MDLNTQHIPQDPESKQTAHQLKMPVAGDLLVELHERFVGKKVEVKVPGYRGSEEWEGVLKGVVRDNSGLVLDLGYLLVPWSKVNSLRLL